MKPFRVAVVGAGSMGRSHMRAIEQTPALALVALVDPAPQAQALARQQGLAWFASIEQLIALDRPDAVVIASPNALHVPQALQAVAAGLPVLLEKPLAVSVEQAQALLQAVQTAGARVLVGHHRAHSPLMERAREVVAAGRIGRVVAVQGSATFFKPDDYFVQGPWRAQAGGGPILLNMIHEVHNLRLLCGEITQVQALSSQAVRAFPVEDTVVVNLRFEGGALGSFLLSDTAASPRSWEQTSGENKAYASYPDEDCYVVCGTHGSLAVPTLQLKTYASEQARSWMQPFEESVIEVQREDPLLRQMAHFAQVVAGQAQPRVTVHDGLQNLRVTEAIVQAARTGTVIQLD